jgi:DNA-binding HxlR family transcriptional regulator
MMRAGGEALSLLAAPLNVYVLKALEEGPRSLLDLRRTVGSPPQSTLRLYLRGLDEKGLIERRRRNDFPTSAEYELTPTGRSLLTVAAALEDWLSIAPDGPIQLGSPAAKSTTKALVEGWTTTIVRAIAARPLSLTELNVLIPKINYPSLERRVDAMRVARLLRPQAADGRGTPYAATGWLRHAIAPLSAAAAWERKHLGGLAKPIGRLDVEAVFLLAVPLMELPPNLDGKCRLAVEVQSGAAPVVAGILLSIQGGKVRSCSSRLEGDVAAWATGTPMAWLRRMNGAADGLDPGGDLELVETVVNALRGVGAPKGLSPQS